MRAVRVAATLLAAAVLVLLSAPAASAHDDLATSDPSQGQRLEAAPKTVTLTFTADVLDVGTAVVVRDGTGQDWAASAPTVRSATVTVPLRSGMPDGGYEVRWRVVSSDGHPISGIVPFTVGDGTPLARDTAAAQPTDGSTTVAGTARQGTSTGVPRVLLIGAIGAAAAAALFVVIFFLRRRVRDDDPAEGDEQPPAGLR